MSSRELIADLAPEVIDGLARTPILLVASDFDGTLAPLAAHPSQAEPDRQAVVALKALAGMPQTHVAIISGRALSDLAQRTGATDGVHLVGSHGSEFDLGFATMLAAPAREMLARLKADLSALAGALPGCLLEEKPAGFAFHYRNADQPAAVKVVDLILDGPGRLPGVHVRHGKCVIELSVVETDKGKALERLRQRMGASAVLFVGDDKTDEDGFAVLAGPDVSVKVGPGETAARYRVADTVGVARLLARVAERRAGWLAGEAAVPIEQHALLSDQRTCALVTPDGRIDWLCLPRIDSAAIFAELLGGPTAGYFEVRPPGEAAPQSHQYVDDTLVLETRWATMRVIDYMDCTGGRAFQRAGRTDLLRVIEGRGRVCITFAPRLDFGRVGTALRAVEEGLVVEGAIDSVVLYAPGVRWQIREEGKHQTAVAEVDLPSSPLVLEMRYGTASLAGPTLPETARRERTMGHWSGWASSLALPKTQADLVRRSALLLRALHYGPTGAFVAAATTSLPECAGGVRNWDYRFCWPRDASLAASSLVRLGATGPAIRFLDWMLGVLEDSGPGALISPVYTVTGGHLASEGEVAELSGYRGSRPVRVGNAAAHQVQLDVFGPIAELVALLAERGAALSSEHWRMLESIVGAVAQRWRDPDHGIWEVRLARQHHVHSKVMCWQTVDRALSVARYLGRDRPDWEGLRATIAADIVGQGWNMNVGAFCATYAGSEPDAAALSVGLSGLLPADDPRVAATVALVEQNLRRGVAVYRYRYDDGLPGREGGFNLCTAWLIEALYRLGRRAAAKALFEEYVRLAGPTGLMAEEYDPQTRMALGNVPQAYSHVGLINLACMFDAD